MLRLLAFSLAMLSAHARAQEAYDFNEVTDLLDGEASAAGIHSLLSGLPQACTADVPRPAPAKPKYSSLERVRDFGRRHGCQEVFAIEPPRAIAQHPDAGLFKDPKNWSPFCSLYDLDYHKTGTRSDFRNGLLEVNKQYLAMDACTHAELNRYVTGFKPLTQKEAGYRPMLAAERREASGRFREIREEMAQSCCGTDPLCLAAVRAVELEFRRAASNPAAPDPCIDRGTFYGSRQGDYRASRINRGRMVRDGNELRDEFKGQFRIDPGAIQIAPYIVVATGKRAFPANDTALAHELGHACSRIRRDLLIRQGFIEPIREMLSYESCKTGLNTEATYRTLFQAMKIEEGTFSCLRNWADTAPSARYLDQPCEKGCPRSHLEEYLANTYSLLIQTSHGRLVPDLIPTTCRIHRDSRHGSGLDFARCIVKTPWVLKALENAVGCRK